MNTGEFLFALARNSAAAAVLVVLVLLAQRIFRKHLSPQWHCALWLIVAARLLPFSLSSDVSIFNLWPHAAIANSPAAPDRPRIAEALRSTGNLPVAVTSPLPEHRQIAGATSPEATPLRNSVNIQWDSPTILFAAWVGGIVGLTGFVLFESIRFARRVRRMRPLEDPVVLTLLQECCERAGVRRPPAVMVGTEVTTPALHGAFRPRLLLPVEFTTNFSLDELRFIFLHELAHLRRRDLLLNWVMTALQIIHWFNPVIWLAFARWRVDREIACDAAALEAAGATSSRAYGKTMLRLLANVSVPRPHPGLVGILEDKRQLHRRLRMITAFSPVRRPFVAVGLIAILGLVGLTDAQVAAPAPASSARAMTNTSSSSSAPRLVSNSDVDNALASELAQRFEGDRTKFLAYLRASGLTVRAYRQALEEKLRAASERTSAAPPVIPKFAEPYVLFLVNGSEAMLDEFDPSTVQNRERGQTYVPQHRTESDDQKRANPKWQRTVQTLEQMLRALPAETNFHVALYSDGNVEAVGQRFEPDTQEAISKTLAQLRSIVPRGGANLDAAFRFVTDELQRPERIVLITDGLPTATHGIPSDEGVTEAQRINFFQAATKVLPPRIPVHTVLMPAPTADPGAAGLYWELANATRGLLTIPAQSGATPRTHLAFVIDTSGSMRNPNSGGLWPIVIDTIEATLDAQPQLLGVQFLDGDGRFILGRNGSSGITPWLAPTSETRASIRSTLQNYKQDTVSNPVPGVYNAIRFLHDKGRREQQMGITILGDEFNSSDNAAAILNRIDTLNPRDATGRRAIVIDAIGFPTTIRYQFSMGNTGLRFANLMRQITQEHGGSFVALPDL
jgi:beta-lactamase regulating signal transducer with metallopeptidase domain